MPIRSSVVCLTSTLAALVLAHASNAQQSFVSMPVLQGDPVPGVAGKAFGSATSAPAINSANNIAFWNRYDITEGALFTNSGGMHVVVKGNDPAPGGGTFAPVTGPNFTFADTGNAAFVQSLNGGGTSLGIWSETQNGLNLIAYNDLLAPSSPPGTFILEGTQLLFCSNQGHLAFTCLSDATGTGHAYTTLFTGKPGSLSQHARQDAPPSSSGFTSLSTVIQITTGGAACLFGSFISDAPHSGVLTGASGGLQVTAATEQDAPGTAGQPLPGVTFKSIGAYAVNSAKHVAFLAALQGGGYTGQIALYVKDAAGLRQLFVANQQVPGEPGGTFWGTFNPPLYCDNGDIIIQANVFGPATNSTNQSGIWRYRGNARNARSLVVHRCRRERFRTDRLQRHVRSRGQRPSPVRHRPYGQSRHPVQSSGQSHRPLRHDPFVLQFLRSQYQFRERRAAALVERLGLHHVQRQRQHPARPALRPERQGNSPLPHHAALPG